MLTTSPEQLFTITFTSSAIANPVDSTIYCFGSMGIVPAAANTTFYAITMDRACILKSIMIDSTVTTIGTDESWTLYVRVNDTTDYAIATVASAIRKRTWANSAMNLVLAQGDTIIIKSVCPSWATNPTALGFSGYGILKMI